MYSVLKEACTKGCAQAFHHIGANWLRVLRVGTRVSLRFTRQREARSSGIPHQLANRASWAAGECVLRICFRLHTGRPVVEGAVSARAAPGIPRASSRRSVRDHHGPRACQTARVPQRPGVRGTSARSSCRWGPRKHRGARVGKGESEQRKACERASGRHEKRRRLQRVAVA